MSMMCCRTSVPVSGTSECSAQRRLRQPVAGRRRVGPRRQIDIEDVDIRQGAVRSKTPGVVGPFDQEQAARPRVVLHAADDAQRHRAVLAEQRDDIADTDAIKGREIVRHDGSAGLRRQPVEQVEAITVHAASPVGRGIDTDVDGGDDRVRVLAIALPDRVVPGDGHDLVPGSSDTMSWPTLSFIVVVRPVELTGPPDVTIRSAVTARSSQPVTATSLLRMTPAV